MILLMKNMEVELKGKASMLERRDLTKNRSYFMICLVTSLRVIKGFMIDAVGLWRHIGKGRKGPLSHVVIPLMGRYKGETGSIHHLQAVFNNTASKLKVRWWLYRFNNELIRQRRKNVPAFSYEEGNLDPASQCQEIFVHI